MTEPDMRALLIDGVQQKTGIDTMRICKTLVLLLLVCTSISTAEPLIVAHRGASKAAPENTIPAFQLAWQLHADAIEGDFYLSKDGKIVCIHDRMTKKVADKNIDVSNNFVKICIRLYIFWKYMQQASFLQRIRLLDLFVQF